MTVKLALSEKESNRYSALTTGLKVGKMVSCSGQLKNIALDDKTIILEHIDITVMNSSIGVSKLTQSVTTADVTGDEWWLTEKLANGDVSVLALTSESSDGESSIKSEDGTKRKRASENSDDEYEPPIKSELTTDESNRPKRARNS